MFWYKSIYTFNKKNLKLLKKTNSWFEEYDCRYLVNKIMRSLFSPKKEQEHLIIDSNALCDAIKLKQLIKPKAKSWLFF